MYLNRVLIIFIVGLNFQKLYCSSTKARSLKDVKKASDSESVSPIVSKNTGEKAKHKLTERHEVTTHNPNLAADEINKTEEVCKKTCHNYHLNKFGQECIMIDYKLSEKAKSGTECSQLCQKNPICLSAMYLDPRKVTTTDLHQLYERVIDFDIWVPLKQTDNIIIPEDGNYSIPESFYQSFPHDFEEKTQNRIDHDDLYFGGPSLLDLLESKDENGVFNLSNFNISTIPNDQLHGFCYIYEESIENDHRLKCKRSKHSFHYIEVDCINDEKCLDKLNRKKCTRGKCGKLCKDYNTIHIPNACMGKYYFGHLIAYDLESCLEFCLSNKDCKSVDFGNFGSCLINYVNRNDTQLLMGCDSKNNEIWDYYEILEDSQCVYERPHPSPNEDVCLNDPGICQNGGNCENVELPHPYQDFSYECDCPCNWCGKHCDKLNMKTFRNGCLNNSVLVWSVAESSSDCIDMCLNEIHCKSVSYSGISGTCVLHWADQNTDQLLASPECPTYRTDLLEGEWSLFNIICNASTCESTVQVIEVEQLKGCTGNPCLNGGECADIFKDGTIIGYHCLCKCGFCGERCESHNFVMTADACIWKSHVPSEPNTSDWYLKSVSLNTCLDVCAVKFPHCRSVDFSGNGHCYLNSQDSKTAVIAMRCNNYQSQSWTLYDLSCVCNNRAVIH